MDRYLRVSLLFMTGPRLTPAYEADSRLTSWRLFEELPEEARFVLGDTHYNAPEVRECCESRYRILVASGQHRGPYPHTDSGVEVRRTFHLMGHRTIENFNGQFKSISNAPRSQVPTERLANTARFALGAVLVHQPALCRTGTSITGISERGSRPSSRQRENYERASSNRKPVARAYGESLSRFVA